MRLIDADAYMEKVCTYKETGCGCCVYQSYCPVDEPTVEAKEVVHGEWIKNKQNPEAMQAFHELGIGKGMGINSIYWTCSKCGSWGTPTSNFCGNCGADMRSRKE